MATRARIGLKQADGTIITAYQHWDGYPGGLGYNLCDNWTNTEKVLKAIQLGGASKWGQIIGKKIDFDDRHNEMYEVQNVYYGRDRGEKDQGPTTFRNEQEYLEEGFNSGEEYIYLMKDMGDKDYMDKPVGTWFYTHRSAKAFSPVEAVAIRDHIKSLKEHLDSIKQKETA